MCVCVGGMGGGQGMWGTGIGTHVPIHHWYSSHGEPREQNDRHL